MRAIVSRHINTIEADREAGRIVLSSIDDDVRVFTQYAEVFGMPAGAEDLANILYCDIPRIFDSLIIGQSVQLFEEAWARGFLRHCCRMLKPGGTIAIPVRTERQAAEEGTWSARALAKFLGSTEIETRGHFAVIRGPSPAQDEESIVDWFSKGAIATITIDVISRYAKTPATDEAELAARLAYRPEIAPIGATHLLARHVSVRLDDEVSRAVHNQSYYINGIGYKAALLKHIARTHLADRGSLSMIDFGGGYGLLMAEMVLDPEFDVRRAVVQDIQVQNEIMALHMYSSQVGKRLEGRFFFQGGSAEAFEFTECFDVISFIGSLLYIPRDAQLPMLERCWNALSPGGILVIHENIQAPSYTRDFDLMFKVEEIDELMERFGMVHRYLSNSKKAVTKQDAAAKTVFRVVQKG